MKNGRKRKKGKRSERKKSNRSVGSFTKRKS